MLPLSSWWNLYRQNFEKGGLQLPTWHNKVPVSLIMGSDDIAIDSDTVIAEIPHFAKNIEIYPVEKCGHFCHIEKPNEINHIIENFINI